MSPAPAFLPPPGALSIALFVAAACHGGGDSSPGDAAADDSSDDSASGCPCLGSNGGSTGAIPCGSARCFGGNVFLCSAGSLVPFGTCGDDGGGDADAADEAPSDCVPQCNGFSCGNDDGCGGSCACAGGVPCVAGACGNGCLRQVGDSCAVDAGGPSGTGSCCATGYACAPGNGGIASCCSATSRDGGAGGACLQDTDCCEYPSVHCQTTGLCE